MFEIKDWRRLREFSHIIWDIDGTITEDDELSGEVTVKIIALAQRSGVYHSFITGRDADWVIEKVIEPMSGFFNFSRVRDSLVFFAEVGCVMISFDPAGAPRESFHPDIDPHPLKKNKRGIRDKLRALAYDPDSLPKLRKGKPVSPDYDVIYDANGVGYLVDRSKPSPKCHLYIWSPYKKAFATLEKVRDENGRVKTFDQTPYDEIVRKTINDAGFSDGITTEVVSTAINVVPMLNGKSLGKSWAAGRALVDLQQLKLGGKVVLDTIIDRTIAAGDGRADLDFTTPTFRVEIEERLQHRTLPIIFVGPVEGLPSDKDIGKELRANVIIQATGKGNMELDNEKQVIDLIPATGPRVVSVVLDLLKNWDYFGPFA